MGRWGTLPIAPGCLSGAITAPSSNCVGSLAAQTILRVHILGSCDKIIISLNETRNPAVILPVCDSSSSSVPKLGPSPKITVGVGGFAQAIRLSESMGRAILWWPRSSKICVDQIQISHSPNQRTRQRRHDACHNVIHASFRKIYNAKNTTTSKWLCGRLNESEI